MCLSSVSMTFKPPKQEIIGWKAFVKGPLGEPRFPVKSFRNKREVPLNRWIKAQTKQLSWPKYECAFHIYATQAAAKRACWGSLILPVLGREVTYKGRDSYGTVYIARQMLVLYNPPPVPEVTNATTV